MTVTTKLILNEALPANFDEVAEHKPTVERLQEEIKALEAENLTLKTKCTDLQLVANLMDEYGLQALEVVEAFKKQSDVAQLKGEIARLTTELMQADAMYVKADNQRETLHAALLRVLQEGCIDPRLLCGLQARQALSMGE